MGKKTRPPVHNALQPIDLPVAYALPIFCISGLPTEQVYCSGAGMSDKALIFGIVRSS